MLIATLGGFDPTASPSYLLPALAAVFLGCPCRKSHPRSSCGMLILMQQSAESVPSSYVKAGELVRSCQRYRQ
jgi:hypothetical protein